MSLLSKGMRRTVISTGNELAEPGPTTIEPEAAPAKASVVSLAGSVVVSAFLSVTEAVAWPALKLASTGRNEIRRWSSWGGGWTPPRSRRRRKM